MAKPVDIIIPVYNGYDDVKLCMESILKYTDLTKNRVLLVNDKSPDERIVPLLKSYLRDHIELIDSPVNEGFSASVNKGMAASDTDVILLNSDTIVTKNWVEKIAACAYHDPETGTVTPLSNSATLCSVPVMCQDNPVPENVTIDEYAEIIERCSLHAYPRITVAVGFCMFIKREVIDLVGPFDAATFERGYGEENDFCNRAEQYGYKHVMCDDTFVYHKGTVSFLTEEKQRLIEAHDAILRERYPKQMENNHLYCVNNPDQYIRDNINMYTELKNGRKNILYLIHADFREDAYDHAGGTQFHVRDLTLGLKEEYNIFVMARDREYMRVTIYCGEKQLSFKYFIGAAPLYPMYTDQKLRSIFDQILNAFRIDLVHIHQTSGLSLDLYACAHEKNIPVIATIHDYYYVCPTIKLVDQKARFCAGTCADGDEACKSCLMGQATMAVQVDFLKKWRQENEKALSLCTAIITPSESAKQVFLKTFPSLADKMQVIAHGSDPVDHEKKIEVGEIVQTKDVCVNIDYAFNFPRSSSMIVGWAFKNRVNNDRVNVIVELTDALGQTRYFAASKQERADVQQLTGSRMYLASGFSVSVHRQQFAPGTLKIRILLEEDGVCYCNGEVLEVENTVGEQTNCKLRVAFLGGMVPEKGSEIAYELITHSTEDIHWYLFGTLGDDRLAELDQKNVTKIGTYERDSIYNLLQDYQIDLICILPIWAETFCYTLSEAWLCDIPVMVTDIGAVGERVKKQGAGIVMPLTATTDEMLAEIQRLIEEPERYAQLKEQACALHVRDIAEMLDEYRILYTRIAVTDPVYGAFNAKEIYDAYFAGNLGKTFYEAETERLLQEAENLAQERDAQQQEIDALRQTIEAQRAQLEEFQASRTYKAVNGIAKSIKKIVRK